MPWRQEERVQEEKRPRRGALPTHAVTSMTSLNQSINSHQCFVFILLSIWSGTSYHANAQTSVSIELIVGMQMALYGGDSEEVSRRDLYVCLKCSKIVRCTSRSCLYLQMNELKMCHASDYFTALPLCDRRLAVVQQRQSRGAAQSQGWPRHCGPHSIA